MLVLASYFWSDALNAFMFDHGPMTPTLLNVLMLTALNIHAPDQSWDFLDKGSCKLETRNIGGWKGYIDKYSKTGGADRREHVAFLNMWLENTFSMAKQ